MVSGPDASNSCLPEGHPVVISVPPVPSCSRGERCPFVGDTDSRQHADKSMVAYAANKLVVCRNLLDRTQPLLPVSVSKLPVLVYRGHTSAPVTAVSVSKSGAYMATGDEKGALRVWALDHPEHLCKYSAATILTGPVRDIDWDGDSKRIVVAGERAPTDTAGACSKAIQWDTGVTTGALGQHFKGRAASCSFKPNRPYRIVTAGKDDSKVLLHAGPPFAKVPVENHSIPMETAHTKGAVHAVRYNHAGTAVVSVGTDRSICLYEGKTMELKCRLENVHTATIYDVAFSADDKTVVTASGDGTCKLFAVENSDSVLTEKMVWKPAEHQAGGSFDKVPTGGVQAGCAFVHGNTPVSVGFNGQISILSANGSCETITGHYAPIAASAVDRNKGVLYTGDTDGIICQWDLATVTPVKRLEPGEGNADLMYVVHTGAISGVAIVAANGRLLTVGWDDKLNTTVDSVVKPNPASLGAQPSAIAAGSQIACIVTVAGLMVIPASGKIGPMISIPYEAQAVAVAADDSTVYVGGKDCKIYVYTVSDDSLTLKHTLENGHLKPIHCLALSNDGTKLASADERDVCVWDLRADYAPLVARGKWCFHVQRVTSLAWSADDSILASGGADDSIFLWSLQHKMTRVHYPYAHRGGVVSLHFMNDMKLLSTGVDSVVNLWDVSADVKAKFG